MNFPYYEIRLKPGRLENGKYKARCSIREHMGDSIIDIQSRWELSSEFDTKEAANITMQLNAKQFLRREYGAEALGRVKISKV